MPRDGLNALELLERLEDLARTVGQMRASQKAFFHSRAQPHLLESQRLERLVDRELGSLGFTGTAQGHLPLGGA